jgi:hypothetical protein
MAGHPSGRGRREGGPKSDASGRRCVEIVQRSLLLAGTGERPFDALARLESGSPRLQGKPRDEVFAIETEQGILLTPYDPTFERAMAAYQRPAGKYRNAFRELSK